MLLILGERIKFLVHIYLKFLSVMKISQTMLEVTERTRVNGGDDVTRCPPLSAYCFIPFQPPLTCVSQIKTRVASEGYHVIITASIPVDGMAKQKGKA
jgi:hypothetical protein